MDTIQQNRRNFLKGAAVASLAVAGSAVIGTQTAAASTTSLTLTDIAVLNFALNLEYVEAEFYTKAVYGRNLEESGIQLFGKGERGPTTGGKKVDFAEEEGTSSFENKPEYSGRLYPVAKQITLDEQNHVTLLRSLLGNNVIAKPAIDLDAMGAGFANFKEFLGLARVFEDVGVSAYGGAATLLSTTALSYAARIALMEAYHASTLRFLVAENNVQSPAVDSMDVPPPPTGEAYFTQVKGLAVVRNTSEVLSIVYANSTPGTSKGGFFPAGFNGEITTV